MSKHDFYSATQRTFVRKRGFCLFSKVVVMIDSTTDPHISHAFCAEADCRKPFDMYKCTVFVCQDVELAVTRCVGVYER